MVLQNHSHDSFSISQIFATASSQSSAAADNPSEFLHKFAQ